MADDNNLTVIWHHSCQYLTIDGVDRPKSMATKQKGNEKKNGYGAPPMA